jgi:hypothetical protein
VAVQFTFKTGTPPVHVSMVPSRHRDLPSEQGSSGASLGRAQAVDKSNMASAVANTGGNWVVMRAARLTCTLTFVSRLQCGHWETRADEGFPGEGNEIELPDATF